MSLDERFFPDFLVAFLLAIRLLVETFVVEARLVPLAPARFLVEAALVFLLEVFLVLFLAPREAVDFFEADRFLLDFLAADLLRAFVVGILSSITPLSTVKLVSRERPLRDGCYVGSGFSGSECVVDELAVFATKQRPLIAEEALPVVDYALVFPPGPLKKIGEVSDLLLFRQTLS
jgi:hypothetical protein